MKFTITNTEWTAAITFLDKVVKSRTTLPILSRIKIETLKDKLRLTATDLDYYLETIVHCAVDVSGSITMPMSLAKGLCGKGDFVFELLAKGIVEVTSGWAKLQFESLDAKEFPPTPIISGEPFTIKTRDFMRAAEFVTPHLSQDESRFVIMHMFMRQESGDYSLVATDGRQLCTYGLAQSREDGCLIRKFTYEALQVRDKTTKPMDNLTFRFGEGKNGMFTGGVEVVAHESRIIQIQQANMTYPDWLQVIPAVETRKIKVSIEHEKFERALKFCLMVQNENRPAVKLTLADNRLTVASVADYPKVRQGFTVQYNGAPFEASFNTAYLLRACDCFKNETIVAEFVDSLSPVVFTGGKVLNVLMPMRD